MSVSRRFISTLLLLALAAGIPLAALAQKPACTTGNISTSSGPVCGLTSSVNIPGPGSFTASAYLGIPYAQPPVGALRWQNPKAFVSQGSLQATAFGNKCPQSIAHGDGSVPPNNQCTDGKVLGPDQSEDCLYLNVWVPDGATASSQLPVLVFIHGGAFVSGSGGTVAQDPFEGTYLAATGKVVVVTFNYRLGVLGFLATNNNYNFGFADQLLALQWVQQNIANFGGNASDVTLAGESAGAMSVGLHALSSPKSAGLFKAGIMESNPLGLPYKSTTQALALSKSFCDNWPYPSPCRASATACDIIQAQDWFPLRSASATKGTGMADVLTWAPAVDHHLVTRQPMAAAGKLGVPLLLGTNHDEGTLFAALLNEKIPVWTIYKDLLKDLFGPAESETIRSFPAYKCPLLFDCVSKLANVFNDYMFTCANRKLAQSATAGASSQPLYVYQFNQVSSFNFWTSPNPNVPACLGKVCHGDELPYVFNTAGQMGHTFQPQEETLAQTVGAYWTSFAASQSHNPGNAWPLFKPNSTYLLLNENSTTGNDPLDAAANCSALWDGIGYEKASTWTRLVAPLRVARKKTAH